MNPCPKILTKYIYKLILFLILGMPDIKQIKFQHSQSLIFEELPRLVSSLSRFMAPSSTIEIHRARWLTLFGKQELNRLRHHRQRQLRKLI